jgi:histidine ammonia-lyase
LAKYHKISSGKLDLDTVERILSGHMQLTLSDEAHSRIKKCRDYLDTRLAGSDEPVYGINTGIGSLYDRRISGSDLGTLQRNLVMSHACGMGDEVPLHLVRLMLLLKVQSLSYGHSGISTGIVERLV